LAWSEWTFDRKRSQNTPLCNDLKFLARSERTVKLELIDKLLTEQARQKTALTILRYQIACPHHTEQIGELWCLNVPEDSAFNKASPKFSSRHTTLLGDHRENLLDQC
jgi:hypothetical protein